MLGENCMTNIRITYEHQLIIINHFQNEHNFAGMMHAFYLFNKVYSKAKKQKGESYKPFTASAITNTYRYNMGKAPKQQLASIFKY